MAKITYTDKDKSGVTPVNKWRDSDANEVKDSVNAIYDAYPVGKKVYKGLVSQLEGFAPTDIVLENTIGNYTWEHNDDGIYQIIFDDDFDNNKVFFVINNIPDADPNDTTAFAGIELGTVPNSIKIICKESVLSRTCLLIEVYP